MKQLPRDHETDLGTFHAHVARDTAGKGYVRWSFTCATCKQKREFRGGQIKRGLNVKASACPTCGGTPDYAAALERGLAAEHGDRVAA